MKTERPGSLVQSIRRKVICSELRKYPLRANDPVLKLLLDLIAECKLYTNFPAGVVKLVDALDSKSSEGDLVSVRFRPPAPVISPKKSDKIH